MGPATVRKAEIMQDTPFHTRDRQQHRQQMQAFLQTHFPGKVWEFSLPGGSGSETNFARSQTGGLFIKLGVQAARYQAMASIGMTPELLAAGSLEDGTSILVQPWLTGRHPTRCDFQTRLEQFAAAIRRVHSCPELAQALPQASSGLVRQAGLEALTRLRERWEQQKGKVPESAGFVEASLNKLEVCVRGFQGTGLVASHNDICNANWLIGADGTLSLIDLESMSMDDPAVDIGATLWWYYPPAQRQRFLQITGHEKEEGFQERMRVRMAMHCLAICLPRAGSFDGFDPAGFAEELTDFRAALAGKENPQGYED